MATVSRRFVYISAALLMGVAFSACQTNSDLNMPQTSKSDPLVVPTGFKRPPIPADNPLTAEKVALGRQLFYEVKLSKDNSLSCAGCHSASASFSDVGKATSQGVFQQTGTRNAPSLVNIAYDTAFFWDGRAHSLEQQATMPITNPIEMGSVGVDSIKVLTKLSQDPYYVRLFQNAFGDTKITFDRIGKAIASFERTLLSGNSAYDRMKNQHDTTAMSASALRGMKLFFDKNSANCSGCHTGDNFTDNGFYATGIAQDNYNSDPGRAMVTKQDTDMGRFKTPTLRNVAISGPYLANGSIATLYDMVKHYNDGGLQTRNKDPRIKPLNLTDDQMNDIVAFLNSLTDVSFTKRADFQRPN
jgi:cytochrome c peroxidase